MAKQDDYVRLTLRLPPELYSKLTELAGAKSLNAEIVERLHKSTKSPIETISEMIGEEELADIERKSETKTGFALQLQLKIMTKMLEDLSKSIKVSSEN